MSYLSNTSRNSGKAGDRPDGCVRGHWAGRVHVFVDLHGDPGVLFSARAALCRGRGVIAHQDAILCARGVATLLVTVQGLEEGGSGG